jgi:hypothetical protein
MNKTIEYFTHYWNMTIPCGPTTFPLEELVETLKAKLRDMDIEIQNKYLTPISALGGQEALSSIRPVDIKTGYGKRYGNAVIWNDSELANPPIDQQPPLPKKGYNKHSHSRFSGGA